MPRLSHRRLAPALLAPLALAVAVGPAFAAGDEKNDAPAIKKANVAHIELSGGFPEAPQPEGPFGSLTQTLEKAKDRIEKAGADDRISAVLLRLDGPAVGFSKARSLRESIKTVRDAGKPVYVVLLRRLHPRLSGGGAPPIRSILPEKRQFDDAGRAGRSRVLQTAV